MLKGQTAVITGSTSGIGLGIAEYFAARGARVVVNGLESSDDGEAIAGRLAQEHGTEVLFHGADMTDPEAIHDLIGTAEARFGAVDILVNNAGIQHVAPVEDFPAAKWDAVIAINLSSAFHTIQAVLPGMKRRGHGRIIQIASAHALVASPNKAAYVAAKHGIAGLTKTVALEAAESGVTVNAICPGYVWTPLVENQIPDTARSRGISEEAVKRDVLLSAQPTREFVTVEQVASLASYLAGPEAASITGTLLPMDGGWTAQ